MFLLRTRPLAAAVALSLVPCFTLAAGVSVRNDFSDITGSPFPSDRFSVPDFSNRSFIRVNLPKPDCAVRPSDCADIDVINTLDGFSTQPRITVPFTGAIDVSTVNSDTVYLVNAGDPLTQSGTSQRVGINQIVWDPASHTLVFESNDLLNQHSRYLLVITDGVRDSTGNKIEAALGAAARDGTAYASTLRDSVQAQAEGPYKVVAASLFTTQSITPDLSKIARRVRAGTPAAADFMIGYSAGSPVRAVFPAASVLGIEFDRQTGTAPSFTPSAVPVAALGVVPGAVGRIAYGRFQSPDFQTADRYIPATGTWTGQPVRQGTNPLIFQLLLPAGPKPAGGWPVAIFGHGFTDSMYGAPWTVASVFASQGIATLSINVVGHGGGPLGKLRVMRTAGPQVTLPAGGRGIDQDGNTVIDSTEGVNAAAPRTIIGSRDGLRQTVIDLMQLVRQVQVGMDVDGDGTADLNAERIYYAGQSFGGIYGTIFLGMEPALKAGVPNVPGGSITEVARLGGFRVLTAIALATRTPQLLNLPPTPGVPFPFNLAFDENMPLRNLAPVVNTAPGALAIAQVLDNNEWVQQAGNPVSYARYIRKQPLPGQAAKPVIVQFAKGDMTVPNPTTTAILRAGGLADRATYFRNDLAYALDPAIGKNPHVFLTNIGNPAGAAFAVGAQQQIATFFASNGTVVIDPDGAGPYFEVPIVKPLPEKLNYLP